MRTRRLVLAKENLTDLCTEEMTNVVGAHAITPAVQCVENLTSLVVRCMTVFEPCPTR